MDYNLMKNNKVFISGEVISEPKFSHEVYGENFFEFDLKVSRLSESYDIIPVTVSEKLLVDSNIKIDEKYNVTFEVYIDETGKVVANSADELENYLKKKYKKTNVNIYSE